ncbi:MAG: DUF3179 domain-containing protein [Nitrospinales bacterium]
MKSPKILIICVLAFIFLSGFDLSRHNVPKSEILSGGPPKDGIPSIDRPKFVSAHKANFLRSKDRVIGYVHNGVAKAYAIKILNWHEIVNDRVGEKPVVVSFCPLCGTGMIFDADSGGRGLTFGVSGLLYQSDMLLYDRQTESLWSQVKSEAVTGRLMGRKLKLLPSTHTTWGAWKKKYPNTLALTTETGYSRNYDRDPYEGYSKTRNLYFPVARQSHEFHPKEQIIGIQVGNIYKAWPFIELAKSKSPLKQTIDGKSFKIEFDKNSRTAIVFDKSGSEYPSVVAFWFAWYTFHPETQTYKAK